MAEKTVETVALVNSYNRLSLLQEAISSLVAALSDLPSGAAIVVFEAGSTDGSREWLDEFATKSSVALSIIKANSNEDTSFSAGLNRAAELAFEKYPESKRLFFFETDNWIGSSAPLVRAIEHLSSDPKLASVGFTVRKHSGESASYGENFPTLSDFLLGPQFAPYLRPTTMPSVKDWCLCEVVYTSPLLVRRAAWEQTKGMDAENFPFSDCDLDWAWRLHELGWKQAVLATDEVVHDNRETPSGWSRLRVIAWHRARLKLMSRHRNAKAPLLRPLLFARHVCEFLVLAVLPGRSERRFSLEKRLMLMRTVFSDYKVDEPAKATSK